MNNKRKLVQLAMEQLSIDLGCSPDDFKKQENKIVISRNLEGRRYYFKELVFLRMATFGAGTVIAAHESMHSWLKDFTKDKKGHWLLEEPNQRVLSEELRKHQVDLRMSTHSYMPDMSLMEVEPIAAVRWFEKEDMESLYEDKRFKNALMYHYDPLRPDMLAVAAYEEGKIMGMAAASADTPTMWQIGIDVLEEYQGRGLGTYLVRLLKNEIIKRGYIPFYSTSHSNLYSQNIALSCGFFPTWVEVSSYFIQSK